MSNIPFHNYPVPSEGTTDRVGVRDIDKNVTMEVHCHPDEQAPDWINLTLRTVGRFTGQDLRRGLERAAVATEEYRSKYPRASVMISGRTLADGQAVDLMDFLSTEAPSPPSFWHLVQDEQTEGYAWYGPRSKYVVIVADTEDPTQPPRQDQIRYEVESRDDLSISELNEMAAELTMCVAHYRPEQMVPVFLPNPEDGR